MENFYTDRFIKEQEEKLNKWAGLLSEEGVHVKPLFLYGNPFEKISRTVAQENGDLIVMGSKGTSGLNPDYSIE